ncbi:hypothetical protein E2C01_067337 [Portunus trituberculatus]|uniref:Uncharacterized protein n=1 Tax=Portunus trituberculatus TaxID=210409 RepID=A0A5B7HJI5_PORTR|nr:hypothetical protein [Portunus trituberculatus]
MVSAIQRLVRDWGGVFCERRLRESLILLRFISSLKGTLIDWLLPELMCRNNAQGTQ